MSAGRRGLFAVAVTVLALAPAGDGGAQGAGTQGGGQGTGRGGAAARRDTTRGFPINDAKVIQLCVRCHRRDTTTGMVERLSYERKAPEGWETSIKRMVALNNVKLDPADARAIVRYLSNAQGLAPAEMQAGRFEAERRVIEHRYTADRTTETTCRACHSLGRVITQRRTRDEWELLLATHRGLYPDVDFQGFRRGGPLPADSAPQPHPMDAAVNHLARAFPLRTPEWTAWSASMRPPPLDGGWLMTGTEPGRGPFFGRLTITRSPTAADEFATRATYRYVRDGRSVTRTGKSIVYTGFQWRGRSTESPADSGLREVMFVEPGWQAMSGRWFRGAYDEFGMDVTLTRLSGAPVVAGVSRRAIRVNSRDQELVIFGANFPRTVPPDAIDLGPGLRVTRVVRTSADSITVRVDADSTAAAGARDLFVAGAALREGVLVYTKIDRIKVTPGAGMARVGGAAFPKQFQQFEAAGWSNGPDGKADTNDDYAIGPVDVTWSLEEYGVTYTDDDTKFVGTIDRNGLFTPALDGPNPQRSANRNNVGDVWVVATWQPPDAGARPVRARAHLVVTVPLYMRWTAGMGTP
jgi:quinohemoprotein amine dehydrogenase